MTKAKAETALERFVARVLGERELIERAASRDQMKQSPRDVRRRAIARGFVAGIVPPGRTDRLIARFKPSCRDGLCETFLRDAIAEAGNSPGAPRRAIQELAEAHGALLNIKRAEVNGDLATDAQGQDRYMQFGEAYAALLPYLPAETKTEPVKELGGRRTTIERDLELLDRWEANEWDSRAEMARKLKMKEGTVKKLLGRAKKARDEGIKPCESAG